MSTQPTHVSEADMLRLQLAESRLSEARAHLQAAGLQRDAAVMALRQRYGLTDADSVQPDGAIMRAAPEPSKETAPNLGAA